MIIVQRGTGSAKTIRREYLLTDAQGSTYAVLDDYGMPINASARMSFDPFGKRRAWADWHAPALWSITLGNELKDTTHHGYTGHEQVDSVGIVHMGGRIYDLNLGRFLQADPFIQAPGNSQSLNRYSYVFNNPMAYIDPTGYWGAREQAGLRWR
ncbi:MAG TPA: RHS repeat-associated core domain-containing protein [Dokdonella sp.]|uniref:RHS repeat-associated core domain-containing protein n=1 Tax=Dokdonella sp. TaxID=2291710 RepID=UPI002D8082B2|nr:RHS repeat-associated core domain-containing protein [Dokdonella sp.]HET9033055.1 RHS repeat-associated core domain-containing protein [Dokdonella sp.]